MPLGRYGVLKGAAVASVTETEQDSPHFQIHIRSGGQDYRIAVNVKSQQAPSELLYIANDDFRHPLTERLTELPETFTQLPSRPGGAALDYIRGNLFARTEMRPLPPNLPGPDNDLSERLEHYVGRAVRDPQAVLYAFGERWGPEATKRDKIFSFLPGNGVHDIHMNQGNAGRFAGDNGVWQDGGLLVHFPDPNQWVAVFLAFQSQAWHTDDVTGNPLPGEFGPAPEPHPSEPDLAVRIVAALVNPIGPAPEQETVTLLNASPHPVDLAGWAVADALKNRHTLPSGTLAPGATLIVSLPATVQLGNKGGIITLLNADGLKVNGVSYTSQQARREGWTIVFS
ncbi:MAG: DUF2278 family protein [Egibacteraceae bacterium]